MKVSSMDSALDLIVASLKRERNLTIVYGISLFSVGVLLIIDLILWDGDWPLAVGLTGLFLAYSVFLRYMLPTTLKPEESRLLLVLNEHPERVLWVRYKADAIEPTGSISWRSKLSLLWTNRWVYVCLDNGRCYPLAGNRGESRAIIQVLQERVPHADFGDSKEMKEDYEARVKAWKEAQSAADGSG